MKKRVIIAVVAVAVALAVGLAGYGFYRLTTSVGVEQPLDGYTEASPEEVERLATRIAADLTKRNPRSFDAAFDFDALGKLTMAEFPLPPWQRLPFREGFTKAAKGKGIGRSLVETFPEETRVVLLRTRPNHGFREAVLRLRLGEGVNYLGLIVARDPAGKPRVVDFYNYMTGERFHVSMRSFAQAKMDDTRRSGLTGLLAGFARPKGGAASGTQNPAEAIDHLRALIAAGKSREALAVWQELPEWVRTTRAGCMLRVQAAQGVGDTEYQEALADLNARFPNDPSLALSQLDGHFLKKEYAAVLRCIDTVDHAVGGDPYLAFLRSQSLLELGRGAEAKASLAKAMEQEPDLIELWWGAIGVALKLEEHGETARLLTEVETRFGLAMRDLAEVPEYEGFVRSPEYRAWRARPAPRASAETSVP